MASSGEQPPPSRPPGDFSKPPPRQSKSGKVSRTAELLKKAAKDQELVSKARQSLEGILFFDHQSESIRKRRSVAREAYEEYVKFPFSLCFRFAYH